MSSIFCEYERHHHCRGDIGLCTGLSLSGQPTGLVLCEHALGLTRAAGEALTPSDNPMDFVPGAEI